MKVPSVAPITPRYLQICEEVQMRLCPVCVHMSVPLFNQMVERIALVQLAFECDRSSWQLARDR